MVALWPSLPPPLTTAKLMAMPGTGVPLRVLTRTAGVAATAVFTVPAWVAPAWAVMAVGVRSGGEDAVAAPTTITSTTGGQRGEQQQRQVAQQGGVHHPRCCGLRGPPAVTGGFSRQASRDAKA